MKLDINGLCFASEPDSRTVRALCAYEGQFTSQNGKTLDFTRALLDEILTASNEHLTSGIQVPVFHSEKDHSYAGANKIGLIEGPFEGKVITEEDLPNPNLTDLIGKFGIFTTLNITKAEAIADYDAKLLKPISIGVDFQGENFTPKAIFEISCVGFGAFPGAQLFSRNPEGIDFEALAQEALSLSMGMTLNDKILKENLMPKLWNLFDAFTSLIREIYESEKDEAEKQTLINQAISDLAIGVASRIKLKDEVADPSVTPFSANPTPEDEDMEQIKALQAQVKTLEANNKLSELYARMAGKAQELFSKRLITPAQLAEFEAQAPTAPTLVATFSLNTSAPSSESAIAGIEQKLTQLEGIEKYGQPHPAHLFANPLGNEPIPTGDEQDSEVDAFLEQYSIQSPIYNAPVAS